MTKIPIYRAKKIDSDEWVVGTGVTEFLNIQKLYPDYEMHGDFWLWSNYSWIAIDPKTLATHFPNMLDKKSKKIFASLSEDGVGGDIIDLTTVYLNGETKIVIMCGFEIRLLKDNVSEFLIEDMLQHIEVIGIHQ